MEAQLSVTMRTAAAKMATPESEPLPKLSTFLKQLSAGPVSGVPRAIQDQITALEATLREELAKVEHAKVQQQQQQHQPPPTAPSGAGPGRPPGLAEAAAAAPADGAGMAVDAIAGDKSNDSDASRAPAWDRCVKKTKK